jgi:hypothetical protein
MIIAMSQADPLTEQVMIIDMPSHGCIAASHAALLLPALAS